MSAVRFTENLSSIEPDGACALLEAIGSPAMLCDETVLFANPSAHALLGGEGRTIVGEPLWALLEPPEQAPFRAWLDAHPPELGVSHRHRLQIAATGAKERWIELAVGAAGVGGRLLRVCTARELYQDGADMLLRESQRNLAAMMGSLPGMAYRGRIDRDWTLEFVSEGCFELTGHLPSDLLYNRKVSMRELIHPDDRDSVWDEVQAAAWGHRGFQLIYRIKTANGQEKWVWEQGVAIYAENGDPTGIQGFINDITERKEFEERLRDNERALGTIISHLPGMAYCVRNEPDWPMEFVSEGCLVLTGYTPEVLQGGEVVKFADLIHQDDRDLVWNQVQGAFRSRQPFRIAYRIITATGEVKWVWELGVVIDAVDSAPDLVLGFIIDISERKRAEHTLSESQRSLAMLVSNLPGMAYRCRNTPEWTMEFVSDGCFELTGYVSSDLLYNRTVTYDALIHPTDRRMVWNEVQEGLAEHRPFRVVYRLITASGEEKWVCDQGVGVYDAEGNAVAIEGFVTDIIMQTKHNR